MTDKEQEYIKNDVLVVKETLEKRFRYFDIDSLKLDQNIQYDFIIKGRGERNHDINTRERKDNLCKSNKDNEHERI